MKNIISWSMFGLLVLFASCTSYSNMNSATVDELVNSQQFTFMAKRANPTNADVINVMNSMQAPGGMRMLDLDYGYSVILKDKEMEVTLPYFGRMFNPSYDSSKSSFRFTSKEFSLSKTRNKKGNWVLTIRPTDARNIRNMYLEIFKNGGAYLSVDADDRQPISYDGYLMKNEEKK